MICIVDPAATNQQPTITKIFSILMANTALDDWENHKLSQYQLDSTIGAGKFSIVSRGRRIADGAPVALKKVMIFDMKNSDDRNETLMEAKLLKTLDHPNVIKCYDAWLEGNDLYIALELAEHGDLAAVIKSYSQSQKMMPEGVVWGYLGQIARALEHLKSKKIMHRDIKPANVFLDASGRLKLGDLGLGRSFASKTLEQAQSTVGTPLYMSPECLQGMIYSYPSDIWSLGCVVYEMCTFHTPFAAAGNNLFNLGNAVLGGKFAPISEAYSPNMHQIVSAMIQLDPSKRPIIEVVLQTSIDNAAKFGVVV